MRDYSTIYRTIKITKYRYPLPIPTGQARTLAMGWLLLALASLVGSGLVVILILLARTPWIHPWIPWLDSFATALVIHVDLSVLVWFLSFAGVITSLALPPTGQRLGHVALALAALGAVLIACSPFAGAGTPYKNNYVPVLENSVFFLGLGVSGGGFTLMALHGLFACRSDRVIYFGIRTALVILVLSAVSWLWSFALLPQETSLWGEYRYELLFWGSGHVVQFVHTQLLMVSWLMLAAAGGIGTSFSPGLVKVCFIVGFLPTLAVPVIQWVYSIDSIDHRLAFTGLMKYGGLAIVPMGVAMATGWWVTWRNGSADDGLVRAANRHPLGGAYARTALILSLVLAGVVGGLGYLIHAVNVTIPAHYHGSIVSVTVAYMGLTYLLLECLGYGEISARATRWQLLLYGGGTLLHALGLAWSGGYGVQRKTAGVEQGLRTLPEQLAMGVAGFGGLIAVIGGLFFLLLVFSAIARRVARPESAIVREIVGVSGKVDQDGATH